MYSSAAFGEGTGFVWMDNVRCNGREEHLSDCPFSGWGVTTCTHAMDAGVWCGSKCSQKIHQFYCTFLYTDTTSNGTIRLVGGSSDFEGRVEIFYGQWGTVCDDFWDLNDATVVCRQLGYLRAVFAYRTSQFGQGTGPIWLDNIHCTGTESRLDQCPHNGIGVHNCIHFEDAGVRCTSKKEIMNIRY